MQIEYGEHGRMSESGSSLLRLIQNQNMPVLDLLVRECVQNSLDAAKPGTAAVQVDFLVGSFASRQLSRHLEGITARLNMQFPREQADFIAVRDRGTVGLTGPVRYGDVTDNRFGNLLKLVYEISKAQQNEGAGGSWGLGKTVYYRVGIGLVLYYSRICQDGRYQSRLAACLVEDETGRNALLNEKGVRRGIAWWGKKDWPRNSTIPVDSEQEIAGILNIFGIPPYRDTETGTTVIIPWIRPEALLNEAYPVNASRNSRPPWAGRVDSYLRTAVQRWYAPRLYNRRYGHGPYLRATVNGKPAGQQMMPAFQAIQDLYRLAAGCDLEPGALLSPGDAVIETIALRGPLEQGHTAGVLAFAKLSRSQLRMDPPDNEKSPYQQITNLGPADDSDGEQTGNAPVICYTRKPGMIVGYDMNGQWTRGMPRSGEGEYILGIFVLNSANTLKDIPAESGSQQKMSLEEYIRKGELADHSSWEDRSIGGHRPGIVTAIQKNVIRKVKGAYGGQTAPPPDRKNIGLGRTLADLLLPPENFGRAATPPPGPPGGGGGGGGKAGAGLRTSKCRYTGGGLEIPFELALTENPCILQVQVITERKAYDADTWETEVEKRFPLELTGVKFETERIRSRKGKPRNVNGRITGRNRQVRGQWFSAEYRESAKFQTFCGVTVQGNADKCTVKGTVFLAFSDSSLQGGLEIREVKPDEGAV